MQQIALPLRVKIAGQHKLSGLAQFRNPLGVSRTKLPLQLLSQFLSKRGTLPTRGNCDLEVTPSHHGGVIEVAKFRNVHHIAQDSAPLRFAVNRSVELARCGGYDCQKCSIEISGCEGAKF